MLRKYLSITLLLMIIAISPVYAINNQIILQQLETLGKHKLAFPIAYQLALKQDNYEVWHGLAKKYENIDTQFASYLQAWKKAEQINTQETYEKFLELRPNSLFNSLAIHRLFELVKAKNSIEEYAKFIEKFGEQFPVAIEFIDAFNKIQELSFEKAKQVNTVEIFDDFIKTFPNSPLLEEAIKVLSELEKNNLEKEIKGKSPEQLETIARKLYNEARKIEKESLILAAPKYSLLNLPVFNVTKTVTEMLDREERKIFEAKLLQELGSIKTSIDDMKATIVDAIKEQSKLLGIIIEQNKDLKITIDNHYKAISKQLEQIKQTNINLGGLNLDLNGSSFSYQPSNAKNNEIVSSIISTGIDTLTNFIPYGGLVKTVIRSIPAIYRFAKRFI